jgi:hypothetical protein
MSAALAWHVAYDDEGLLVFAPTRGKARRLGASDLGMDFVDPTVRRAPEYDAFAADPRTLTAADCDARGWEDDVNGGQRYIAWERADGKWMTYRV